MTSTVNNIISTATHQASIHTASHSSPAMEEHLDWVVDYDDEIEDTEELTTAVSEGTSVPCSGLEAWNTSCSNLAWTFPFHHPYLEKACSVPLTTSLHRDMPFYQWAAEEHSPANGCSKDLSVGSVQKNWYMLQVPQVQVPQETLPNKKLTLSLHPLPLLTFCCYSVHTKMIVWKNCSGWDRMCSMCSLLHNSTR